jgi:acyl-CoA reductase-like NAD-dependent aldehyde dehydrogenase
MTDSTGLLTNQILIGDEFLDLATGGSEEHRYPATGKVNGTVTLGAQSEIVAAVERAKQAQASWEALGPLGRRDCIGRLGDIIENWSEDFKRLSAAETGMPQKGFIWRHKLSVEWFRTYQGWADRVGGEITNFHDDGTLEIVRPEPYGVVGIIITWNSPLLSLAMKVPAALAAGNTVVIKPSELTPYTPLLFGKACLAAGIPPGVVNVVPGGAAAGEALVVHPDVEKISFTGGLTTATRMMQSGAPLIKPFCFELGGKSAYTIFPDADLELAASLAVGELSNAGQSCKFGSRIFVHEDVYAAYRDILVAKVAAVAIGDPEDERTHMGPLITAAAQERVVNFIEKAAQDKQGELLCGGGVPQLGGDLDSGYFVAPTVFESVDLDSPLAQDEIFGPVYSVMRWRDEDEVIRAVNNTKFGLSNYVHTKDLKTATSSRAAWSTSTTRSAGTRGHLLAASG